MNENIIINENSKVIASNNDKLLVVNDCNISIDNLDKKAYVIDMNGNIIEEITIGVIIKFGYWKKENIMLGKFKKKYRLEKVFEDALLGFSMGDAFGLPFEFLDRKKVREISVDNIMSGGYHKMPAGTWSDDTSLVIATIDSLINANGINYDDIMKKFSEWLIESKYTPYGKSFGVGNTTNNAINKYIRGISAVECGGQGFYDNGNGALMRIFPISFYCIFKGYSLEQEVQIINNISSLTHAHEISKMGCLLYTEFLREILVSKNKELALKHICSIDYIKFYSESTVQKYKKLLSLGFKKINEKNINQSGYVVDTLEAVIYSIFNGFDYRSTILTSVNLGYDTDTVSALAGAIAGILYGENNIPEDWIIELKGEEYLKELAQSFSDFIYVDMQKVTQKNNRLLGESKNEGIVNKKG